MVLGQSHGTHKDDVITIFLVKNNVAFYFSSLLLCMFELIYSFVSFN